MIKTRLRVVAVEYLNTAPFVAGLQESAGLDIELELLPPAACSNLLAHGKADVGLIPVATIPEIKPKQILSEFCIGANGAVRTVKLFANSPIGTLKRIYLDGHSRTSIRLLEILLLEMRITNVELIPCGSDILQRQFEPYDGVMAIGDKVFHMEGKFAHEMDLAQEWVSLTHLGFVFACWVSMENLDEQLIAKFNQALSYGLNQIGHFSNQWAKSLGLPNVNAEQYLSESISYTFDEPKKAGLRLFLDNLGYKDYELNYK